MVNNKEEVSDLNIRTPKLPRKNDSESLRERKLILSQMNKEQIEKYIVTLNGEKTLLEKKILEINKNKDSRIEKAKIIQSNKSKVQLESKSITLFILSLENFKKSILSIQEKNSNLTLFYTKKRVIRLNEDNLFKEVEDKVSKLFVNTLSNKNKLNNLPKEVNFMELKNIIVEHVSNSSVLDLEGLIKKVDLIIKNKKTINLTSDIFNSLLSFGSLSIGSRYNNDNVLVKYCELKVDEQNTAWRELNIYIKKELSKAINNLLKI